VTTPREPYNHEGCSANTKTTKGCDVFVPFVLFAIVVVEDGPNIALDGNNILH
jgi:hypothetical protein